MLKSYYEMCVVMLCVCCLRFSGEQIPGAATEGLSKVFVHRVYGVVVVASICLLVLLTPLLLLLHLLLLLFLFLLLLLLFHLLSFHLVYRVIIAYYRNAVCGKLSVHRVARARSLVRNARF